MSAKVSIGVPVFNGERFLGRTLDSILAQTYSDLEIVIADNASTDHTPDICSDYARRHGRVTYVRSETNVGAAPNFNRAFEATRGEYFKWCACDDLIAPEFIARCVEVLDERPDVVVCHSKTVAIDANDEPSDCPKNFDFDLRLSSSRPHVRFGDIINQRKPSWVFIFGLMRRGALEQTRLFCNFHSSDRNLLSECALVGKFHSLPEPMFYWRSHPEGYTDRRFANASRQAAWWGSTGHTVAPHLRVMREYRNSILQIPLGTTQRWLCYTQIVRWLIREGWFRIGRDIYLNVLKAKSVAQQC